MNREFLEGLGLEKEAIDKVMAEHGKTVNAINVKLAEVESTAKALQEQLNQRDADITELKKNTGSNEELKNQLDQLQGKYKEDTEAMQQEIKKTKLNSAIDMAITKNKARNTKAVKALLDAETLELTDEGVKGLDDQLKKVKEDNPFLFDEGEGTKGPTFSKNGNPQGSGKEGNAFQAIADKYK